jgi:hypothetical protein
MTLVETGGIIRSHHIATIATIAPVTTMSRIHCIALRYGSSRV